MNWPIRYVCMSSVTPHTVIALKVTNTLHGIWQEVWPCIMKKYFRWNYRERQHEVWFMRFDARGDFDFWTSWKFKSSHNMHQSWINVLLFRFFYEKQSVFYIIRTCPDIRLTWITLNQYQQYQMFLINCYILQIWKHDIWHNELKHTVMHRKTTKQKALIHVIIYSKY